MISARKKTAAEGYVYNVFGSRDYLKYAVASVISLRRYDTERPIALVCEKDHKQMLEEQNLTGLFDIIYILKPQRTSIIGFKHNVHEYMFFQKNMYLDSDIIWCKNPDALWKSFEPYGFTTTGTQISDNFFGRPKNAGFLVDVLLQKRSRTLKRFGLTHLSRVQTGIMYAQNYDLTRKLCKAAQKILNRKNETHFKSRAFDYGRNEETDEWSIAMAMSQLDIPVYPWLQGHTSPQLDYVSDYTDHDPDFEHVVCTYYCDQFVYNLRGLKLPWLRKLLTNIFSLLPGKGDYLQTTPFCLHFSWYHQKEPFFAFAKRTWNTLKEQEPEDIKDDRNRLKQPVN